MYSRIRGTSDRISSCPVWWTAFDSALRLPTAPPFGSNHSKTLGPLPAEITEGQQLQGQEAKQASDRFGVLVFSLSLWAKDPNKSFFHSWAETETDGRGLSLAGFHWRVRGSWVHMMRNVRLSQNRATPSVSGENRSKVKCCSSLNDHWGLISVGSKSLFTLMLKSKTLKGLYQAKSMFFTF